MKPVLCLPKHTPQSKKYRAERPPFLFLLWSEREYPYSAQMLDEFLSCFWQKCSPNPTREALRSPFGPGWGTTFSYGEKGVPLRGKTRPFTTKQESLLGGFWATFSALFIFRASGTQQNGVCPEGLRRVPVHTKAQFSLLQLDPKTAAKWKPKLSVLGSQI